MKRIGHIYEKICDRGNIQRAMLCVSNGKKSRPYVEDILNNIEEYTDKIQKMLLEQAYTPSHYKELKIIDGISKKERIISKPRFYPDQIIHWALMLQIKPIIMKGMYHYNCGSIPHRGTLYARNVVQKAIRQDIKNTKYCLKLDITKFFPNIDKEILKHKFEQKIKDKKVLNLINKIIDSCDKGLPIGTYPSQYFSNFYLQDLDHYIKEQLKVKYYVRYMDDMVLLSPNKKQLRKQKLLIDKFLEKEKLIIKHNWQVFPINKRPIDFCGYIMYRDKTHIRKSIRLRILRNCREILKQKYSLGQCRKFMSYNGWVKNSDSYMLRKKYIIDKIRINKIKKVISSATKQ